MAGAAAQMAHSWCGVCGTRHTTAAACPGELHATGDERHGWRVAVRAEDAVEAYGVLVAPCDAGWRSRVVTFPNSLWVIPGGAGTIKFLADTPQGSERMAIGFILKRIRERNLQILEVPSVADHAAPAASAAPASRAPARATQAVSVALEAEIPLTVTLEPEPGEPGASADPDASNEKPAVRKPCTLPASFGRNSHRRDAEVLNVSERGLFLGTADPLDAGAVVQVKVTLDACSMPLRGVVVWSRVDEHDGRPQGMGIRLSKPPALYVSYVREL